MLEEFRATVDARAPDIGDQLAEWAHHYNWDRPHEALAGLCPIDRVCEVREYAIEVALRQLK